MALNSKQTHTSPKGVAIYPRLNSPDYKFKDEGEFKVKLSMPLEQAQAFIDKIEEARAEAVADMKAERAAKGNKKKMKEADPPYEEMEDGTVQFNFKMKHKVKGKKDGKVYKLFPALFDAKGKPLAKGINIGGGSVLKVAFNFVPFDTPAAGAGVTMRMSAVQVIDLVEFGQKSASGFGFGEEDGFDSEGYEGSGDEDGDDDDDTPPFDDEDPGNDGEGDDADF